MWNVKCATSLWDGRWTILVSSGHWVSLQKAATHYTNTLQGGRTWTSWQNKDLQGTSAATNINGEWQDRRSLTLNWFANSPPHKKTGLWLPIAQNLGFWPRCGRQYIQDHFTSICLLPSGWLATDTVWMIMHVEVPFGLSSGLTSQRRVWWLSQYISDRLQQMSKQIAFLYISHPASVSSNYTLGTQLSLYLEQFTFYTVVKADAIKAGCLLYQG